VKSLAITAEVALAAVLLIAAGLLIQAFRKVDSDQRATNHVDVRVFATKPFRLSGDVDDLIAQRQRLRTADRDLATAE
jgi:hypothetical protein